ncbi:MAG: hypothetical protein ACOYYS_17005 [Chloroflexota bacterium]
MKAYGKWIAAALVLFLFFFALVLFVFRDFVREEIVIPILYAFWLGSVVANSVSQIYYLLTLLILGLILAVAGLRYLLTDFRLPGEQAPSAEEPSRYQFWLKRSHRLSSGGFFLSSLGMELRRMVLTVLAYQEHRDMWELEREIVEKQFDVPPDVQALIAQRQLGEAAPVTQSAWSALLARFFKAFRLPESASDGLVRQRVENIVAYLEKRLEVKHDRRDS